MAETLIYQLHRSFSRFCAMLSRPQFDDACKAYIARHPNHWTWKEHPVCQAFFLPLTNNLSDKNQTWPGFGYMSRSTVQRRRQQSALQAETQYDDNIDEAAASIDTETLTCQQHVVYSATFQVPTFYFTMHNSRLWKLCYGTKHVLTRKG